MGRALVVGFDGVGLFIVGVFVIIVVVGFRVPVSLLLDGV